jgi:hypothetical protein
MAKGVKTGISDDVKNAYRLPSVEEFTEAYKGISAGAIKINAAFGQTKQRLVEIQTAIADTAPGVKRLGGGINEVTNTINEIAKASRRNVIANSEDVSNMFAAQKILGGSIKDISNSFLNVGVGISQIPKELEKSINYIQSIGGNTVDVMKDVQTNMEQMNRYQFEGGVQGLTKMAAQASMLRFEMKETFTLAERVLDPEEAIKVASAFQRLGVSAGSLVDPFSLMNQSINDPSGLQDSLVNVSKQFTYFDEKTKTFKINPQGVLTLKEMEKQTGVSAKEMSKMGLAAAELDQRLSAVNMAGLNIKEEDKQYLANIAKMGEGGDYEVKLTDDKGNEYTKKLSEVTQTEMDKLIKEQKEGPKTLEEIARSQLTIDQAMLADIKAMRVAFEQGVTSPKQVRQGLAGAQRASKTILGETSDKFGKTKDYRDLSEGILDTLGKVATDLKEGNKPLTDVLSNGLNGLGTTLDASQKRFTEVLKEVGEKIAAKLTNQTGGESVLKSGVNKVVESYGGKTSTSSSPLTSSIDNKIQTLQNNNNIGNNAQVNNAKVDVSGKIEIDVKAPTGVSTEQMKQMFDKEINGIAFQDYMSKFVNSNNSKEPVSKTYTA